MNTLSTLMRIACVAAIGLAPLAGCSDDTSNNRDAEVPKDVQTDRGDGTNTDGTPTPDKSSDAPAPDAARPDITADTTMDIQQDGFVDVLGHDITPRDVLSPDTVPWDFLVDGSIGLTCQNAIQCNSGFCVDGVCCDTDCTGKCSACNIKGKVGTCSFVPSGQDPKNKCGTYTCNGSGGCYGSCGCTSYQSCASSKCDSNSYCDDNQSKCVPKLTNGVKCSNSVRKWECQSNICRSVWGTNPLQYVCCDKACSGACEECSTGTCKNKPAGADNSFNYRCTGNGPVDLYSSCTNEGFNCSSKCTSRAWCWQGKCLNDLAGGSSCLGGCQCQSNVCLFFFCT